MEIRVNLKEKSYNIVFEDKVLDQLSHYANLNRNVLIVTDSNIPVEYAKRIQKQCKNSYVYTIPAGEASKNFDSFLAIQKYLTELNFSRSDLIIALGGGVVGDLTGFVASTFKRGIEFINIPTSTLSMIDSSIGGKTAVDFNGIKNIIGTFYQPSLVLIDLSLLASLDQRNVNNGLVEALKAGLIYDKELYYLFKDEQLDLKEIIYRSILVKKDVVEKDEKETSLRKILNFGHTIGHGFEAYVASDKLLHGEAVALGMLYVLDEPLRSEVKEMLENKLNIQTNLDYEANKVYDFILNDKKANKDSVDMIYVKEIGKAEIVKVPLLNVKEMLERRH